MTVARAWIAFVAAVTALVAAPSIAFAHAVGVSTGTYTLVDSPAGARLGVELRFARQELQTSVEAIDRSLPFDDARSIAELVVARSTVTSNGVACAGAIDEVAKIEGDAIEVHAHFDCAGKQARAEVVAGFVDALSPSHRHFAHVVGETTTDLTLHHGELSFALSPSVDAAPPKPPTTIWSTLPMGIEHILTGYDHLLFLFALVIVGGSVRSIVGVVTAFTVAHSITLATSVTGLWVPSPRLVEPAIALSIAIVGAENFFITSAAGRWRITFPFGLLHGFGFASALREIGLPRAQLPSALLLFNVGVELGQLAVLAIALPLIFRARKQEWFRRIGVRALSAFTIVAGLAWFVDRIVHPS